MKNFLIIAFTLISSHLLACVHNGEIHQFKQPDNTFVEVKLYGSQSYMWAESLDGYTVVRDDKTGWICYADLSSDASKLIPTTIKYRGNMANKIAPPSNFSLPKHLRINSTYIEEAIKDNNKLTGFDKLVNTTTNKTPVNPILGNYEGLTIIVDFSDAPGQLPLSEYEDLWNGNNYTGYGNNGSIKEYWSDVSNGLVVYENVVFGIFRPSNTFAYYDGLGYTQGAHQILQEALTWIDSQGFDFSTLSIKNGRIQAINLMYTGAPGAWAQGMWYHAGGYYGFSADGVSSGPYNCSSANSPLSIGTPCHENGHMLCGWPDTYKYDGSQAGLGNFDLMCGYPATNPTPPNPHFTIQAGWNTVVDVTNFNGVVNDIDWDDKVYKYEKNGDNSEFFLLKSARKTNRGAGFNDEGLTIWHIDTDGNNQTNFHEVYLKHANNDWTNHSGTCFDFNADEFSNNSIPNANWHDGSPSNLYVWNVQAAGAIQDYNIGLVTTVPNTDFTTSALGSCNGIVSFTDLSNNSPTSWYWDFGDGNTSTAQHPTHTYLSSGTYTVILTSTNVIGSNTETKTNYVTVNVITAPTTTGTSVCVNSSATLTAAGSGVLNWYASATGGPIINTGTSYVIPSASTTTTYYVADVNVAPNQNMGKSNNTGGGNDYNFQQHLFFDVYQAMEIISVEVYAGSVGNRTFELRDSGGNVLQTTTINLALGQQTVNLNFNVTPGTNYQLGLSASTANISMFRNNAGVTYPYNLNGVASITGSSAATNPADYYYFFYNWVVKTADCESPRSSVTVNVLPAIDLTITNASPTLTSNQSGATYQWLDCDNGNAIIPSATNQFYSATSNGNYAVEITVGSCIDTSACENINGLVTAVPNTEFSTNTLSSCNGIVSFTDLSNNSPTSWSWNFGDGNTSTAQHPTHTYLSSGTYTVILTSTNVIGSNTETKTNYITVGFPAAPTTTGTSVCVNSPATLTAAGSGVLNWYNAATGGPVINTGSSYVIPSASATTTYYVADVNVAPNQNIGKLDNTGGGNDYNFQQHLFFDAYQAMEIISVEVYAGSVGNRTFELRDSGGNVLQSSTINLVFGHQTVNLNFNVTPGTNYQLGLSASTANISMYRNNAGVTYPYNLNGIASITGSSAATNPANYYYFFYNWVVKTADCESPRSSVTVNVSPTLTGSVTSTICNGGSVIVNGTTYNAANPSGTEVYSNVGPNNCDSVVTVNLNVLASLTGSVTSTICNGGSVIVNGTTYNAANPSGTEVYSNVGPNNCDSVVTVNLNVLAAIDVSVTNSAPILTSNQAGASYQWLDCNNGYAIIPSATNQSYTTTTVGNYAVEITVGNCVDTSACENINITALNELDISNLSIYPNPTRGELNIEFANSEVSTIHIINMIGETIYHFQNVDSKLTVDLSSMDQGVYFIRINDGLKLITRKVILTE